MKSNPGIGVAAAEWLAKQDPMLVGGDTHRSRSAPTPIRRSRCRPPDHAGDQRHSLLENLKLDELAAKKVYEFAFVMQPLKLRGFTGSTVVAGGVPLIERQLVRHHDAPADPAPGLQVGERFVWRAGAPGLDRKWRDLAVLPSSSSSFRSWSVPT